MSQEDFTFYFKLKKKRKQQPRNGLYIYGSNTDLACFSLDLILKKYVHNMYMISFVMKLFVTLMQK